MRNLATILLTVVFTTALLIGCDFVDSNTAPVQVTSEMPVEASYDGYYATEIDTMGYEDLP